MELQIDEYKHIKGMISHAVSVSAYEQQRQAVMAKLIKNGSSSEETAIRVDHNLANWLWSVSGLQRFISKFLYPVGVSDKEIQADVVAIQEELFGKTKLCMLWENKEDRRHIPDRRHTAPIEDLSWTNEATDW